MKLSVKQIVASVFGALLAALLASFFGVKGTVVGVAIGSAAATIGSAVAFNSLDKGHKVVKEIVIPIAARFPSGDEDLQSEVSEPTATIDAIDPWERAPSNDGTHASAEETRPVPASEATEPPPPGSPVRPHEVVVPAATPALRSTLNSKGMASVPAPPPAPPEAVTTSGVHWPVIAVIALVFALTLGTITVVELAVGKPLSSVVHGTPAPTNKTSVGGIFGGGGNAPATTTTTHPATTTTLPVTTSTTHPTTTTTSTTTTTTSSTTTTTTPSTSSTTTTAPVVP